MRSSFIVHPLCSSKQLFSVDVRLTHNHVTFSVSILRSIILLLLNYTARNVETTSQPKEVKQLSSDIFHFFIFVHDYLQLSASFSTYFLLVLMSRVCVSIASSITFIQRDVLMKNQLPLPKFCVWFALLLNANSRNVAKPFLLIIVTWLCAPRSHRDEGNHFFLEDRHHFIEATSLVCADHILATFDLDVNTIYHTFSFSC